MRNARDGRGRIASAAALRRLIVLDERVAVIRACRHVDEVIPNAPDVVTGEFLAEHDIALVVHGDDISDQTVETLYGDVAALSKLRLVHRAPGISTTEVIRRVRHRDV